MFASSAKASSTLKQLHARSSRATRKALNSMGSHIGHAIGIEEEPALKRQRVTNNEGCSKALDLTDDDVASTVSSSSRNVYITHTLQYAKVEDVTDTKGQLQLLNQLREVTKEQLQTEEDEERKLALVAENKELMQMQNALLRKMLNFSTFEGEDWTLITSGKKKSFP